MMKKTISVIGLVNNVYNNFHIPKKIKINYGTYEEIFKWDEKDKWYVTLDNTTAFRIDQERLTDEVEIMEEDNKIEKISNKTRYYFSSLQNGITKKDREELDYMFNNCYKKIDELIDVVNNLSGEQK